MLKMLIFYEKMKKYVIMYAKAMSSASAGRDKPSACRRFVCGWRHRAKPANEGANGSRVCTADLDTMLMNIENRNKGESLWNPLIF